MIKRLLITVIVLYLLAMGLLYVFQRGLMYHPQSNVLVGAHTTMKTYNQIKLKAEDGVDVYGWVKITNPQAPTVVYFHGNAESAHDNSQLFNVFSSNGYNVFALEYRGYGGSNAKITEAGIFYDARAAMDYLRKSVDESRIILFGRSLGTGVALKMASEYNVGGVVLQSPCTSVEDLAAELYPYFPIKQFGLLKDKYDSVGIAHLVTEPVLIIHGRHDDLVPFSHAEILMQRFKGPRELVAFEEADHINGFDADRIVNEINRFYGSYTQ